MFGEELIDNMVEELLSERLDEKIKENEASLQNLFEHIKTTKEILPRAEFLDISKSFMIQWHSLLNERNTLLYIKGERNEKGEFWKMQYNIDEFREVMGLSKIEW